MTEKIAPNDNLVLTEEDRVHKKKCITTLFEHILDVLGYDLENHNLVDTPKRVAKTYVDELFKGCFTEQPTITIFPNTKKINQMVVVGPIKVKSTCAHHFLPFIGEAYIAYIPSETLCGLSKLARIVDWYARRPQIQEELTQQIVEFINDTLSPRGCGVYITSSHLCMTCRGVEEENSYMDTCALKGSFIRSPDVKAEFLNYVSMKRR